MATVHDSRGGSSKTMLMYGRLGAKVTTESTKTDLPTVPSCETQPPPPSHPRPAADSDLLDPRRAAKRRWMLMSMGCGSRGGTSRSGWDCHVGVAGFVHLVQFVVEVERPVLLEVAVAA